MTSVWSHLCQGFAGIPGAPLPGSDICPDCPDGFVELSLVFKTACSWKLIKKIATYVEDVLQEMLMIANVVGSK